MTKFCDNKMKRKQLIECLAPNRRVTVEVVGRALKPRAEAEAGGQAGGEAGGQADAKP